MPVTKGKSGRPTDGQKSLLSEKNGSNDELDDNEEWVVSYNKGQQNHNNSSLAAETASERRRHDSNVSAPRSVRSRADDLELDDTGFVDEPATVRTRINRRVFILIIIGVILGVAAIVSVVVLYFRTSYIPENYVIVIDAGSAHTKLHVFHYRGDKVNGTGMIERLGFLQCNDTLLNFTGNPGALREVWKPCLDFAITQIPDDRWEKTEVYVGATAGLRHLRSSDPVTAERLMDEVRIVVNDSFSPRLSPEHLFVMILNGDEEGALAWASGNFVTKRLLPDNNTLLDSQHETYGSLDLGGSSTQIAFASSSTSTPANFELTFFGVQYHLYSKSFSCRGKGEAVRILKAETVINSSMSRSNVIINPCLPLGAVTNETHSDLFGAQCTMYLRKPAKSRPYYTFEGTGNITQCRRATRTLFQNPDCPFSDPECSFSTRHKINVTTSFMGFAGLYFVMDFFNLTDEVHGVNVKLDDFRDAYKRHCETPWLELANSTNPFMKGYCFDGIYIDMLLTEVYGFTEQMFNRIEFRRAINGVPTGWSVGLALNSTNAVKPENEVEMMSRAFFLIFLVIFAVFLVLAISFLCRGVRRSCRDSSI